MLKAKYAEECEYKVSGDNWDDWQCYKASPNAWEVVSTIVKKDGAVLTQGEPLEAFRQIIGTLRAGFIIGHY